MDIITEQLEVYISNKSPSKPLVMIFHGGTGIGKTYMTFLIAKSLYKSGADSPFFHYLQGVTDFSHDVMKANRVLEFFLFFACFRRMF